MTISSGSTRSYISKSTQKNPINIALVTTSDVAIQDKELMARVCHYVMVHMANSLYAHETTPSKKQYFKWVIANLPNGVIRLLSWYWHNSTCSNAYVHVILLHSHVKITEKWFDEVKARACDNGSVQWEHITKEEATAPTITSDAIFIQGTIFAHEGHHIATCDIPGAFLQTDNPDYVLMCHNRILAQLVVKVVPSLCYPKYITTNAKGKPVLYYVQNEIERPSMEETCCWLHLYWVWD